MIKSLLSKFKKNQIETENTVISSLAPKVLTKKEDIDKIRPYLDQLRDTLNTKGINNIALTGGYGSGKSTIIKTFQYWNDSNYNFLNISLAAFNQKNIRENFKDLYELKIEKGKSDKDAEKEILDEFKETIISNEELEKQLEISILQQIIYKVKPSDLPDSRFKRIVNIPKFKLWFLIPICCILWLSSFLLLIKYNYLDKLNPNTWTFKFEDIDLIANIIFLLTFLGIGYFSKLIVVLFSNSKINKVNLKGEIEIGDNSNKSILNEHYDEILYFFERNDFNVVVIEDLDRFENTNIFTKLRELNILLNNSATIKEKKAYRKFGIKFLYAVGDDLFDDKKERVKFFEYIIPVIPFINSSNAGDQLRRLIKESGLEDENLFTNEFLSDVITFIDDIDMRLLINIFQEFVIFRKILKSDLIKKNDELFAIITYKNIDPKDFKELNSKNGKLYELVNNKKIYIENFIKDIDDEIEVKDSKILEIKSQSINDIKELRSIYVNKIIEKLPPNSLLEYDFSELLEDEGFENILNQTIMYKKFTYNDYYKRYDEKSNIQYQVSFSEIEKEINSDYTYEERVDLLEAKHNNQIDLLINEINDLKLQKSEVENWDLKQIFNKIDVNQYLDDFSNNKLLRNLILNGYINENYNDYISLFHEESITKEDFSFERNVKSGYVTEFNYKLSDKIENLIERIHLRYFERETILNFDLLNYLGNNYNRYSDKYNSIIRLLSNEKENSIRFIEEYIKEEDRPIGIFIEKLVERWKGFIDFIYWKGNYSREVEDKYLELILRFSEIETIIENQNTVTLKNAIEDTSHFLSLVKNTDEIDYLEKITKLFTDLKIEFDVLDNPTEETGKLFEFVYNNHHYKINGKNLLQMISKFGKENIEDKFTNSNYSTILNSDCEPLIEYVNSNIKTYVENVYLKLEDNKFEDEVSLCELLNNEGLEDKLKIKIIQKVETKISDLSSIDELEIKKQLLINNKIIPTWNNVINYYTDCENKIDDILTDYLNFENVYLNLSKEKMIHKGKVFNYSLFRENLLLTNELTDESYVKLLESSIYKRNKLSFENLNNSKVKYLTQKILETTKDNYDLLKKHFSDNHLILLEQDFKTFIDKQADFDTDENDILLILKSANIRVDDKFKYIIILSESIIIGNKEISKLVGEIILQKSKIIEYSIDALKSIVVNLSNAEKRIKIINLYFEKLSDNDIVKLLSSIWNYNDLFKNRKPTFSKTEYNRILLEKLKSRDLIKNYYDNKWNLEEYRVTTNY